MTRFRTLLACLSIACTGAVEETGPTLETGWFTDTGGAECPSRVVGTIPKDGADDVFWRDPVLLTTSSSSALDYEARLYEVEGPEVSVALREVEGGLQLDTEGPLRPSTQYELVLRDCTGKQTVRFSTSAYGTPIEGGPATLVGRTYAIALTDATWVEPGGFAAVLAVYFNQPILVGVDWATDALLDLVGAQGVITDLGTVVQWTPEPTWDFPAAGFESPYFQSPEASVTVVFDGVSVPIHGFSLEGTFAADGEGFAGGRVQGLGDTRNMAPLVGETDPGTICDFASSMGATCEACPDGQKYCLFLAAEDVVGTWIPDLRIRRVDP